MVLICSSSTASRKFSARPNAALTSMKGWAGFQSLEGKVAGKDTARRVIKNGGDNRL